MFGTKELFARLARRTSVAESLHRREGGRGTTTIAKESLAVAVGGLLTTSLPAMTGLSASASSETELGHLLASDEDFAFVS